MSSYIGQLTGNGPQAQQYKGDMSGFNNNNALTNQAQTAQKLAADAQNRQAMQVSAAQAGPTATAAGAQVDQTGVPFQTQALNQLQLQSQGGGPSAANLIADQRDNAIGTQGSMALSMGGRNPALAQRQAMQNAAGIQQQGAFDAAKIKAQEMQGATSQLGALAGQVQGQNLGAAQLQQQMQLANAGMLNQGGQFNAGLAQQAVLANQGAGLQQQGMNNSLTLGLMGNQLAAQQTAQQNQQAGQQFAAQQFNHQQDAQMAQDNRTADQQGKVIGGAASALALSDENMKENVKDVGKGVQDFLDHLTAKSFKYTKEAREDSPDETGEGERTGVIAQDVAKSKVGKNFVKDTPRGKMLDVGGGMNALLASVAYLNKQIKDLK